MCYAHVMSLFKVVLYTKSYFVKEPKLRSEGGEVYTYSRQEYDFWSYFEVCDLIKGMDSKFDVEVVKLWWKQDGDSLEEDLKTFRNDGDAI